MYDPSNPLTTQLKKLGRAHQAGLIALAREKINTYKGTAPLSASITGVTPYGPSNRAEDHFVVIWEPTRLDEGKVSALENLMADMATPKYTTRRRYYSGRKIPPKAYRTARFGSHQSTRGYLFSENPYANQGLFVERKFRSKDEAKKILRKEPNNWLYSGNTFVELRLPPETTNLAILEATTQVSNILATGNPAPTAGLVYDLYHSLSNLQIDHRVEADLAGLHEVIDFMRWTLFGASSNPLASSAYGMRNRSAMLAGVYGVGKTSIAKVLAREPHDALFIPIEAQTLLESLAEKEREENSLFDSVIHLQERAGVDVHLFCDDIELAMIDHEQHHVSPGYMAGLSDLLNRLQGVKRGGKIFLNGSTNNPMIIDQRFLEFGRVGYIVHVPLPNEDARLRTFEIHTREKPIRNVDLSAMATKTRGYTPRMIEEVCIRAGEQAFRRAAGSIKHQGENEFEAARRVTSEMIEDFPITQEDFNTANATIQKNVRPHKIIELDRKIRDFCGHHNSQLERSIL